MRRARAGGGDGVVFDRAEAYLGVMIDDLVTRGVTEPYRMFTSRAEYRLTLRADNADQRLTGRGIGLGCVGAERGEFFLNKMSALEAARSWSQSVSITPNEADRFGLVLNRDGQRRTAYQLLSYPHVDFDTIARIWPEAGSIDAKIARQVETDAKYAVYLARQAEDVERFRRDEALPLSSEIDYAAIPGLSMELRQKLAAVQPRTIGQADRIDGMTPAALALVAMHARRVG
jgi:tRNA uridine 5-carboxymethylaminomethyl modification enzyme